ncbi:hypothetical protein HJ051_04420 [Vibrio parahaemolyticus]|nr:hypothetical protein [Vibrio parahaemolyticus]
MTALATTTQKPDIIDVIWFDKSELASLDLEVEDSPGTTPYSSINGLHCDIVNMNYQKLGELGEYMVKKISDDSNIKRFSKNKVIALVTDSVNRGDVDIRSLTDKWKAAVDPANYSI